MAAEQSEAATVLFVDDEPAILSALRRLFRPEGYKVLMSDSGASGLAQLESAPVDLVVSDMRMPGMDGAAFLEQVRLRWPDIGRILLTGYADINSTIAAINRGEIHRYFAKPWDDRDLVLGVRDSVERQRLVRRNRALQDLTRAQNEILQALNVDLDRRVKARTSELEQVNAMLETSFAQLEENFLLSIDVFTGLLELRQDGMAGYSREVADLARRTARHLASKTAAEQDVYVAGLLHEIGKIGLPDALLQKPLSAMTGEEQASYRGHVLLGEAALMPLARLQRPARFVRSQLERVDGKGFPDGLAGEEVPLGAQILAAVSDYFGAQHGRLAVKRRSPADARAMVISGAGTHYAVAVIEAFKAALEDAPEVTPADREVAPQQLEVGMVLARDWRSPRGTLLLAAGFVFDERAVRQVRDFSLRQDTKFALHVKHAAPPPRQAGAQTPALQERP
ncbi:MAG: response regulator [Pelomonas sp.]|nr:response regulator [Roseateles sp.]